MSESILDIVSFTPLSDSSFQSVHQPDYYGGFDPRVGFGGWSIAFGINTAAASVGPEYNVYSVTGNFLRAASTSQNVTAKITRLRDTKSFATRRVELLQEQVYACFSIDFARPTNDALLTYSRRPRKSYAPVTKSLSPQEQINIARNRGVSEKGISQWHRRFGAKFRKFDQRSPPDSLLGHLLSGLTEGWADEEFDALSMPDKTACEYIRHRLPLKNHLDHVLAIAFVLDTFMPFTPLLFSKLPISKVSAIGSLDFALRIFTNDLNLNDWTMTEEETMVASESRTYSESRMWNEQGKLIAGMTQQCILKPSRPKL